MYIGHGTYVNLFINRQKILHEYDPESCLLLLAIFQSHKLLFNGNF